MPRLIYSLLFYCLLPGILLRLWWRGRLAPAYRQRLGERFGFFPPPVLSRRPVWFHAVSVGETLAIAPLVKALQQARPELPIVITTMTPTGSERVQSLFGDRVFHVYAPYDTPGAVARFFRRINPSLVILVETEVWPNIIHRAGRHGTPVILANARMSERSCRGYGRLAALTRPAFAGFSKVLVQTEIEARRFLDLGVRPQALTVTGSIKFDVEISPALRDQAETLKRTWSLGGHRSIWLAASTHAGEDEIVLALHQILRQAFPELLLVLVPRHPERFDRVHNLCLGAGLKTVRRRSGLPVDAETAVLLADTMGEMLLLLGTADVVFMGGSLVPAGGHNMLEPAAWALPVVSGPHVFNFQAASDQLQAVGALVLAEDGHGLARDILHWLENVSAREAAGQAGAAVIAANRGALRHQLQELLALLP